MKTADKIYAALMGKDLSPLLGRDNPQRVVIAKALRFVRSQSRADAKYLFNRIKLDACICKVLRA